MVSLGKTCKLLSAVTKNELFWQELVQENVPGVKLQTPSPCASFRELFKAHDPHWFLSKNKLWFSDNPTAGRLMIAKYHPKTGSIGLHDFFVNKLPHQFSTWEDDDHVIVHSFEPEIRLKISCRQLKLDIYSKPPPSDLPAAEGRLKGEVSVSSGLSVHREYFENWLFMLAKAWAKDPGTESTLDQWPPPNIPAKYRVDRTTIENQTSAARLSRPVNRSEINEESFRIRRWLREHPNGSARPVERVETWSTLDSRLYTPTEEKPYRGIFVSLSFLSSFISISGFRNHLLDGSISPSICHCYSLLQIYKDPDLVRHKSVYHLYPLIQYQRRLRLGGFNILK